GTLSPDGHWLWDGTRWIPAPPSPAAAPPPYAAQQYGYPPPPPYGYPPPGYPAYGQRAIGPAPGIAYAGFLVRAGASILDGLMFIVPFITFIAVIGAYANQDTGRNDAGVAIGVIGLIATILAALAYSIVLPAHGGTLGMRALRLRVARADNGANIGMTLSFGRWLVYAAIAAVGFWWLDSLWVIWDERKQSLHDKAVGTLVVRPIIQ
ncbi:MAG TPA: RDD family protein, partial [Candidatus Dormibacteraeota bacterium]